MNQPMLMDDLNQDFSPLPNSVRYRLKEAPKFFFQEKFIELMEKHGVGPVEVHEGSGIPESTIFDFYKGNIEWPTLKHAYALAKYFKVPIEDFVKEEA